MNDGHTGLETALPIRVEVKGQTTRADGTDITVADC